MQLGASYREGTSASSGSSLSKIKNVARNGLRNEKGVIFFAIVWSVANRILPL